MNVKKPSQFTPAVTSLADDDVLLVEKANGTLSHILAENLPAGGGGGSGDLLAANNLSDLDNIATARTNLGLGTAATANTSAFDAAGAAASAQAASQPVDADLTAIAALSASNDDVIQRKAGAWTNRTPAQLKTDLSLTKSDVGLGNCDNTTDVGKPVSTAQAAADAAVLASAIQRANHTGTQALSTISDAGTAASKNIDTDGTLAANSDTLIATQKAVKTYADSKQAALGFTPEDVANRVTAFQGTPDDTHYPTEKLLADSVQTWSFDVNGNGKTLTNLKELSVVPPDGVLAVLSLDNRATAGGRLWQLVSQANTLSFNPGNDTTAVQMSDNGIDALGYFLNGTALAAADIGAEVAGAAAAVADAIAPYLPASGTGSPEGVVTRADGVTYRDTVTGDVWMNCSGTIANTGWVNIIPAS